MKIALKFLAAAVLSLCIGVAVASPLLATEIIPFPKTPQGPTADFGVDVVYADFKVKDAATDIAQLDYQVILNVTNLADIEAKLGMLNFAAAQNVTLLKGASEGASAGSSGGGNGGGHFGTVIEGVWLDGQWHNVTWIPGTHPDGIAKVMTPPRGSAGTVRYISSMPTAIPDLPDNASETGYYMEGVPLKQYFYFNSTANKLTLYDTVYVNGTWVNVTGRIRIENPKTSVLTFGRVVEATTRFEPRSSFIDNQQSWNWGTISQNFFVWSGDNDFNNTWAPHQSRLIQMTGTVDVGSADILNSLTTGKINLYSAAYSYVYDQPVNGTFYDTSKLSTGLMAVSLTKTADGNYLYNNLLSGNQTLQLDQYGAEAFITPRS